MVGLGSETPNTLTKLKSNVAIKKSNVKKQSIAEAAAEISTTNIVAPEITTNTYNQDEEDWQNTARIAAIGVKEEIAAEITVIVSAEITNQIVCTTDGSDFRTVDKYALHQLLSAITCGAERPSATAISQMMAEVMAQNFDWQESAAKNLEKLSTTITKISTYGVLFNNNMKMLVFTENIAYAEHQTGDSKLAQAQSKIKSK